MVQGHRWDLSVAEAKAVQEDLRKEIVVSPLQEKMDFVAGADVSFDNGSDLIHAAVVVLRFPSLEIVEKQGVSQRSTFPYVPGLLAFREGPCVQNAWEKLEVEPDIVLFDGHGLAHPRRFGLACHLGVVLNVPSIGCAKSVLVGSFTEPGRERGQLSALVDEGEEVGVALRTRDDVSPVFVTIGHRVDLPGAVKLVLACSRGYRIPEPTRQAHLAVNALRRGEPLSMGTEN